MIVAGGTYGERCRYPAWDHIYGSGLRAAMAVSAVSPGTHLHTFAPSAWCADIKATLEAVGLRGTLIRVGPAMTFGYLHPFELIDLPVFPKGPKPTIEVNGDVVLCFGMIEGDAKVKGRKVVYDPQFSSSFFSNGSSAGELALIVTREELVWLARKDRNADYDPITDLKGDAGDRLITEAVIELQDMDQSPNVILVKDGLGGLSVYQGDDHTDIDSYAAESYFRIGAGDVLAAAFTYAWGEEAMDPVQAAHYAARCVAFFVEGPRLPIPDPAHLPSRPTAKPRAGSIRILASGDTELQFLVTRTINWIMHLGGTAIHEIFGVTGSPDSTVAADLVLIGSRTTWSELKDAASRLMPSRPVVVYWPGEKYRDFAEVYFPGAEVTGDYATALYRTMRRLDP